jgi:predicted  nucleic acid-binding Zn-ribbon protein
VKSLLQNLARLQDLELGKPKDENVEETIADLRGKIPSQILGHYDRLMARGKTGIAPVRNQACTGCHMRLPIGVIATLMRGTDIQLCDSCGRYLYLPDEPVSKIVEQSAPTKPVKPSRKRKSAAREAQS